MGADCFSYRFAGILALLSCLLVCGCSNRTDEDDDDTGTGDDDTGTGDDDSAGDDDDTGTGDDDTGTGDDDTTVGDDDDTGSIAANSVANLVSFASSRENDWSGESVAIVGDVNGDGFDDIAIGAPAGGEKEQGSDPGQLYLFFGSAEPTWGPETPLSDADVAWEGEPNDDLGFVVVGPGDWNGDGYDDIVVSAPHHAQGNAQAGRVWILFGRASGWPATIGPIADDAIEILPDADNARFGMGLGAIGDINDDGRPDFAATSPQASSSEGQVYVFFGTTAPIVTLAASTADVRLRPGCTDCWGSNAGMTLAGLGDINGDSIDDFAIGAPESRVMDGGDGPLGRVYVIHGRTTWDSEVLLEADDPANGRADTILVGTKAGSIFGQGIAGGDVTGDGNADLIVGAPHNDDSPFDSGALYVFVGGAALGETRGPGDAEFSLVGQEELDSVGYTLATGDFDGDGLGDLVVGAPEAAGLSSALARSGRVHLISSSASSWPTESTRPDDVALATWLGDEYPHWVGEALSVGGDVNGDGYDDILVGANKSSSVVERGGQCYLIFGGESSTLEN